MKDPNKPVALFWIMVVAVVLTILVIQIVEGM